MRVDIKEILRHKSPRLERWMPWFVKRYLRRIVHEDQLNYYLDNYSHLPSVEFIRAYLRDVKISSSVVGMERLDPKGRYIFASNHPFGGLDGVILAMQVSDYFGDVRVVVNDILMNVEPLASIFIPVNKHGPQMADYAKQYNDALESDLPIITFPAGLCSRRKNKVVQDLEWKHSFVRQAIETERDIVPVYFYGELSNFFYRLANLRTALGVKANIEMLYLVDEMFKQSGRHFDVIVGEPMAWQSLGTEKPRKMAEMIREEVYDLKNRGE